MSNIGAIIWSATADICLFSHVVGRNVSGCGVDSRFLLAAGLVTTMLLIDDLFVLHELQIAGLPEEVVFLFYAAVLVWFTILFRAEIFETNIVFLGLAYLWFGLSVFVDVTVAFVPYPSIYLFEDGAKLAGILSWATYFVSVSIARVRLFISPAP